MVAMRAREEYPAAAVLAVLQMHFVLFQRIPIGLADFGGVGQWFIPSAHALGSLWGKCASRQVLAGILRAGLGWAYQPNLLGGLIRPH